MFFNVKEDKICHGCYRCVRIQGKGSWPKSRGREGPQTLLEHTPPNSMEFLNPWPNSHYIANLSVNFEYAQSWYKLFSPNLLNSRAWEGRRCKTPQIPPFLPTVSVAQKVLSGHSSHRPRSTSFLSIIPTWLWLGSIPTNRHRSVSSPYSVKLTRYILNLCKAS